MSYKSCQYGHASLAHEYMLETYSTLWCLHTKFLGDKWMLKEILANRIVTCGSTRKTWIYLCQTCISSMHYDNEIPMIIIVWKSTT